MNINGLNIETGSVIKFKTHSVYDLNQWDGTVVAICDYNTATLFTDIVAYQQGIDTNPDAPEGIKISATTPLAARNYIVVECRDGKRRAFAVSPVVTDTSTGATAAGWIDLTTLSTSDTNDVAVMLYGVSDSQLNYAIALLKNNGYICNVL